MTTPTTPVTAETRTSVSAVPETPTAVLSFGAETRTSVSAVPETPTAVLSFGAETRAPVSAVPESPTAVTTFSKVFWINLDETSSRATHMRDFLRKYKLEGERVPGVRPEEISLQPDLRQLVTNEKLPCRICANCQEIVVDGVAFASSCASDFVHRRAYALVAKQQDDEGLYLVTEDDVDTKGGSENDWVRIAIRCIKKAPEDWVMLRIGSTFKGGDEDLVSGADSTSACGWLSVGQKQKKSRPTGSKVRYNGAHAIVLTPARARKVLQHIVPHSLSWADSWTGDSPDGHIKSYVLKYDLIRQNQKEFGSIRGGIDKVSPPPGE